MEFYVPDHDYGRQNLDHGGRRNFCPRYFRLQADLFNIRHLRWNIPIINYDTRNPILTHKTGRQEGEVKAQLEEDGVAWHGGIHCLDVRSFNLGVIIFFWESDVDANI